jgi:hypothetical protein
MLMLRCLLLQVLLGAVADRELTTLEERAAVSGAMTWMLVRCCASFHADTCSFGIARCSPPQPRMLHLLRLYGTE